MTRANINLWMTPELYESIVEAAAAEQSKTKKVVTLTEWVREACTQRLEK